MRSRLPEPVPLDRVECAQCRMLVSSDAGAAEIVSLEEETRFFDDVGCVAVAWASHRAGEVAYVRTGAGWTDATAASFARPAVARTAMGSGYVAFASEREAQAADRDGRALTWADVVGAAGGRP